MNLLQTQRKAWDFIKGLCTTHEEDRIVVNGHLAAAIQDHGEFVPNCGQNIRPKSPNHVIDQMRNNPGIGQIYCIGTLDGIAVWVDPYMVWRDLHVKLDGRDDLSFDVAKQLNISTRL